MVNNYSNKMNFNVKSTCNVDWFDFSPIKG